MSSPTVTVVIPTKDRPGLLRATLASVLAQRDVDLRVVVVDDGSAQPVALDAVDDRVQVVRHAAPRGVSAARNAGLAMARTPWTAFVDDDDLWSPLKLRRQLDALAAAPDRCWACSTAAHFSADGTVRLHRVPAPLDLPAMLRRNAAPGGGSGVLVRTSVARELGGFDEQLSVLADWDCWLRLATRSPAATVEVPDVGYRVHTAGMAHDVRRSERELRVLQRKHADLAAAQGVALDREDWTLYLASLAYAAGDWRAAGRLTLALFLRHRQPLALLRGARRFLGARLAQRPTRWRPARPGPAADAQGVAQVRSWLADLV